MVQSELDALSELEFNISKRLSKSENEDYFKKFKAMEDSLNDVYSYILKRKDVLTDEEEM